MQMKRRPPAPKGRHAHREPGAIAEAISPRLFRALSDPNRIALLARLSECRRPCGVTELSGCCAVDLSVVSRHLATLKDAGILVKSRKGKEIYYEVRASELARSLRAVADAVEGCCGGCPPAPEAAPGAPRAGRSALKSAAATARRSKLTQAGRGHSPSAGKDGR